MSCNTCNTKFNFFHKEMGCANCGMSFCNKCLKQKCRIPSKGPSEFNVCRLCFNKLTSTNDCNNSTVAPPDTYLKRLENLENPSAPPITIYKQNSKFQKLRTGLTPADQKLVDRLEKLKDDKNKPAPPSETELRKRLANLKGENFVETSGKNFLPTVDSRTNQKKVDDLLEQYSCERDIELQHNPQEEIEARLATLREQGVRPNEGSYVSNLHDSDDSEEETNKITKKIMDEVALEQLTHPQLSNKNSNASDMSDKSSEQWCVLCNKDPKFRCFNHIVYDAGASQQGNDSFLQHFIIERDIHLLHNTDDIERRLADLRDQVVDKSSSTDGPLLSSTQDSSNSDSVDYMIRKVMNEVALDEKAKLLNKGTSSTEEEGETEETYSSTDVLPWCVLCNNDAKFRCLDCGGDLYCAECNKEVHQEWQRDHKGRYADNHRVNED